MSDRPATLTPERVREIAIAAESSAGGDRFHPCGHGDAYTEIDPEELIELCREWKRAVLLDAGQEHPRGRRFKDLP